MQLTPLIAIHLSAAITGRLTLSLRGSADKLAVSRLYSHLFKAM